MKRLFCFFSFVALTFLFNSFGILAQSPSVKSVVDSAKSHIDFSREDAYFIFYNVEMEVINENSDRKEGELLRESYATKIRIRYFSRFRLNTKNGVDNYGNIVLTKNNKSIIKLLEVTAIKAGGTEIKFDSSQIFHLYIPDQNDSEKNKDLIKYAIPGIEPGDEIQFKCEYEVSGNMTSNMYGNVFLNNYMPTAKSSYSIKVPYPYAVFYKCYNGFKNPTIYTSGSNITSTFLLDSISVIKDLQYASLYNEIPYFYYSIEYNKALAESIHWKDQFNEFNQDIYQSFTEYDALSNKWIKKILKPFQDMNKFQQFKEGYSRISESFDTSGEAKSNPLIEKAYSSTNDIYRYRICYPYVKLLQYLNIDYFTGYARNKYYGKIDENFIRRNEITDIFLMYYDNDSNVNIVYPNGWFSKYYLNEIPVSLNGTDAFIINMNYRAHNKPMDRSFIAHNDSDLIIKKIRIQRGNEKLNYYQRIRIIGVDLNSEEASYQSTINLSGSSSTTNRFFFDEIFHDKEKYNAYLAYVLNNRDIFKVDSIYLKYEQSRIPFKYSVNISGKLKKFYNYINDSTILISIEEILNNNIINYNKQYRNLDLVLPYKFTDIQDLIIEFDRPFRIVNKEALQLEVENVLGSYKFQLIPMEDHKLRLTSTYIIKQDNIAKTMLNQLDSLNDAVEQMQNSKVIVAIEPGHN